MGAGHPSYLYDNFEYWYLSALAGHPLLGGAALDADTNDNGQVSTVEAYNCALPRPGGASIPPVAAQMPQFEDTGVPPSRSCPLPAYGEGVLGSANYL